MTDNRQLASVLALVGGILGLGLALLMGLVFAIMGTMAGWAAGFGHVGGAEWAILGVMGAFAGIVSLVGIASGIVLLVASSKLKADDPEVRRQWAIWAIVAGAVGIVGPGSLVSGGLGVAAGAVTLSDLNRPAPAARAP